MGRSQRLVVWFGPSMNDSVSESLIYLFFKEIETESVYMCQASSQQKGRKGHQGVSLL